MIENTVFKYVLVAPAVLGLLAIWIVIGSVGARIARGHAETRSARECPRCQAHLKAVRQGIHHRIAAKVFLVDIARYACRQCGFRQSVWRT